MTTNNTTNKENQQMSSEQTNKQEQYEYNPLAAFESRMARWDNISEWRLRGCGMRAEADAEKAARISAMERGEPWQ